MDFFSNMFSEIGSLILEKLNEFVGMIFFWLTARMIDLLQICENLFNIFSGTKKVIFDDQPEFLIDVFFKNNAINNVYWAMALLGIVFVVGFTIVAVIRKTFDMNDSQKMTMGGILGSMFKSILTILVLGMVMSGALTITNSLVSTLGDIFNNADSFNRGGPIVYTNEDYATMARIYKTIGNYSLNPSYSSRYNMNSCFNDIRQDLLILENNGIFDQVYPEPGQEDDSGLPVVWTWQSVLEKIVYAADLNREAKIDSENEDLFQAIELAINQIRTNSSFYPIDRFSQEYAVSGDSVSIANVVFLSGTSSAAKNPTYNRNPYITDGLRGAYFRGQKDITSYETVKKDFNISLVGGINYLLIAVLAYYTIKSLFRCIVACVSRIINMLGLYIIAPLAIATMPTDEGAKFKQWTTSMIVQMLGIFGYIIPMRLLILFVPILMGSDLVLFDGVIMNYLAKAFLVVGSVFAIQEFSGIINGILADMAGHASLDSGRSVQKAANKLASQTGGAGKSLAKGLGKYVAAPVIGGTLGAVGAGIVGSAQWVGGKVMKAGGWVKDKFTGSPGAKGTPDDLKSGAAGGTSSTGDSASTDSASGNQPTNHQGTAEADKQSQPGGDNSQGGQDSQNPGNQPTNHQGTAETDKQSQSGSGDSQNNQGNQNPQSSQNSQNNQQSQAPQNAPAPGDQPKNHQGGETDKQSQSNNNGPQAPGGSGQPGSNDAPQAPLKQVDFSSMASLPENPAPQGSGQSNPSQKKDPASAPKPNAPAPGQQNTVPSAPLKSPPPKNYGAQ